MKHEGNFEGTSFEITYRRSSVHKARSIHAASTSVCVLLLFLWLTIPSVNNLIQFHALQIPSLNSWSTRWITLSMKEMKYIAMSNKFLEINVMMKASEKCLPRSNPNIPNIHHPRNSGIVDVSYQHSSCCRWLTLSYSKMFVYIGKCSPACQFFHMKQNIPMN